MLAHDHKLSTHDLDALPKGISIEELDVLVKKVATENNLSGDWLNPYFSSFVHTLPNDYGARLIEILSVKNLRVLALGKEDLLIMKCFAHRPKDVGHALALIRQGADTAFVDDHIEKLIEKRIPDAKQALEFLEDLLDQLA